VARLFIFGWIGFIIFMSNLFGQPSWFLFDHGQPSPALCHLMEVLGIPESGSQEHILEISQKLWMQKGKERWEFDEYDCSFRDDLLSIFEQLGCVREKKPIKTRYDYAIILGGLETRMRQRISFLLDLVKEGVHCEKVILLAGERPLLPQLEPGAQTFATESELLEALWNETCSSYQISLPFELIATPMKQSDKGLQRPNTEDTIVTWLDNSPPLGSCLVISNQPFIPYQHLVILSKAPHFQIETVGPQAEESVLLSVYLDNLAKWIYQENKYKKDLNDL
jgi:hypothetical protein